MSPREGGRYDEQTVGQTPEQAIESSEKSHRLSAGAAGVPGYEVLDELGRGGMGVVYRARQTSLNRIVALKKVLNAAHADPRELVRFLTEAEVVAAIQHPHVVGVYEFGQHDGLPYVALEFLPGGSLSALLRDRGKLPPMEAAELVGKIARGVQAAHDLGIVHRDLKPANVLLDGIGEPKVTDFGLAKRSSGSDLTNTNAIMGTPAYMAPEQAKGQTKFVGPAADVYSLGVILYECLCGKRPFESEDALALIVKVANEDPGSVRTHAPGVPRDLDLICLKCLHKDPKQRYPSAAALADDLKRYRDGEAITARPATVVEKTRRWVRRNPGKATAIVAAVAMAGFLVGFAFYESRIQRERADELQKLSDQALQSAATAQEQTAAAEAEKAKAILAEHAATTARTDAIDQLYAANVDLAYREWQQNNVYRTEQLLNETPVSLRGWEWRFLKSLTRQESLTLRGHVGEIVDLAISPDGTRLLSADNRDVAITWDLTTGRELRSVPNTSWPLRFSPDGKTLIATANGKPTLMTVDEGRELHVFPVTGPVVSQFTDGGKRLLTISRQTGIATRWDVAAGTKIDDLPGKLRMDHLLASPLFCPRISPDGTKMAFGGDGPPVQVVDLATGKQLVRFQGTPQHVCGIAFQPGGSFLAVGFPDGALYLWDLTTKKEVRRVRAHGSAIHSVSFSRDGKRLATGGQDMVAKVWDVGTGTELTVCRGHTAEVTTVAFTPDGKRLVTGSGDRSIRVWDLADNRFFGPPRDIQAMSVWASGGGELKTLIARASSSHHAYYGHLGPTRQLVFHPDGKRLATTNNGDGLVAVWDLETNTATVEYAASKGRRVAVAFSKDGKRVATVSQANHEGKPPQFQLWDVEKKNLLVSVTLPAEGDAGSIPVAGFTPDGGHVVVCLTGGTTAPVRVFEVPGGKEVASLPQDGQTVHAIGFTPDGQRLIVGTRDRIRGYDWPARTVAFDLAVHASRALAVGPGGLLAAGGEDGLIRLIDPGQPTSKSIVRRLEGHVGAIRSLAFSPDGSRLVSAGTEMAVKIWNPVSGRELLTFRDHAREIDSVGWSPDGRRVAACGWDGSLRVWSVPVEDRDSTENWKLLLAEQFDDPATSKRWIRAVGNWTVENGALRGEQTSSLIPGSHASFGLATIGLPVRLPRTFEVRYTLWSPTPRIAGPIIADWRVQLSIQPLLAAVGNQMGQVGAFVLEMQQTRAGGGYLVGVPRDKFAFEPGRKYHVRVLRDRTRLTMTIDGVPVLSEFITSAEAPTLALGSMWGNPGDLVYYDDVEVRAPAAAILERSLLDRFDGWRDTLLLRELVAEEIDRAGDLSPADRQFLQAQLPTVQVKSATLLAAVTGAVYRRDLSPAAATVALRQARAAARAEPGNWSALFLRALAEYRAGEWTDAQASAREALASHRAAEGSAEPGSLTVLALAYHRTSHPEEARVFLRQATDLLHDERWRENENVVKLHAEAVELIAPPADPEGDAIRSVVFLASQRGWNHGDVAANLAAYADDAIVTNGRLKESSDLDVAFDRKALAVVRPWHFAPTAHKGYRTSFENVSVRVRGDRAELEYTTTGWVSGFFITWSFAIELRRTSAGWRITRERSWPLLMRDGAEPVTHFGTDFYRSADANVAVARAAGDERKLVRELLHAQRVQEAFAVGKALAAKPGATAADQWNLAEAARSLGRIDDLRAAIRAAMALKPATEPPWFVSRARGRWSVSSNVLYGFDRSPDGTEFVAGGVDPRIQWWDRTTGKAVRSAGGHTGVISDVRYSPDGTTVASIANDGLLKLWDSATGKERWSTSAHAGMGFRLAFSPDGKRIVSVGSDSEVKVWDATTGRLIHGMKGHVGIVYGVAWSADGNRVASSGTDATVRVWDPEKGSELHSLRSHRGTVMRVAFAPTGTILASSGTDGTIRLWDAATGAEKAVLNGGHQGTVEPLAFSTDGKLYSGGTGDGRVAVWDVATGKLREVIPTQQQGVYGLAVSKDGMELLTTGVDGTVRAWSLAPW